METIAEIFSQRDVGDVIKRGDRYLFIWEAGKANTRVGVLPWTKKDFDALPTRDKGSTE